MPDEMGPGEVGRTLVRIEDALTRVLTIDVWKAEREAMEWRIREVEKDSADNRAALDAKANKSEVAEVAASAKETEAKRRDNFKFTVTTMIAVAAVVVALIAIIVRGASA